MREIGAEAVRTLLARVADRNAPRRSTVLPTNLVVRRSCGCRPARSRTAVHRRRDRRVTATTQEQQARAARDDWERRIYRRLTDTTPPIPSLALPAPRTCRQWARSATCGSTGPRGRRGRIPDRASRPGGEPALLQHGGSDVPAVPPPPSPTPVSAWHGLHVPGRRGRSARSTRRGTGRSAVTATPLDGPAEPLAPRRRCGQADRRLNRVWHMVGSERLTQLRFGDDGHGHDIGTRVRRGAAHRARRSRRQVRPGPRHPARRQPGGHPGRGRRPALRLHRRRRALRPAPRASASVRSSSCRSCRRRIAARSRADRLRLSRHHLAAARLGRVARGRARADRSPGRPLRRGRGAQWGFEVWNEPNLEVFWTGTQEEYLRLYAEAAAAVKAVDTDCRSAARRRRPASGSRRSPHTPRTPAAAGLRHHATPTATCPLDTRAVAGPARLRRTSRLVDGVGRRLDALRPDPRRRHWRTVRAQRLPRVQGRMDALAYWVISDHFEELGRPPRAVPQRLRSADRRQPAQAAVLGGAPGCAPRRRRAGHPAHGDGADVLVRSWATRHDDGTVDVLVWNGTVNGALLNGAPGLERTSRSPSTGSARRLPGESGPRRRGALQHPRRLRPETVDGRTRRSGGRCASGTACTSEPLAPVAAGDEQRTYRITVPMPGVVRIADSALSAGERRRRKVPMTVRPGRASVALAA